MRDDFFPDHRHISRRFHADPNRSLRNTDDGDRDIISDQNFFADFS